MGRSSNGEGVFGTGYIGVAGGGTYGVIGSGTPIGGAFLSTSSKETTVAITSPLGGPILTGTSKGTNVVSIDGTGNLILAGTVTQSGTPVIRTKTQGLSHTVDASEVAVNARRGAFYSRAKRATLSVWASKTN